MTHSGQRIRTFLQAEDSNKLKQYSPLVNKTGEKNIEKFPTFIIPIIQLHFINITGWEVFEMTT